MTFVPFVMTRSLENKGISLPITSGCTFSENYFQEFSSCRPNAIPPLKREAQSPVPPLHQKEKQTAKYGPATLSFPEAGRARSGICRAGQGKNFMTKIKRLIFNFQLLAIILQT